MCVFGKKYSKPSTLYNNLGLADTHGDMICGANGLLCEELKQSKNTSHEARIGHSDSLASGPRELMLRCEIPVKLVHECLRAAVLKRRGKRVVKRLFVIDLCCGWQSVKTGIESFRGKAPDDDGDTNQPDREILYVGVDVDSVKSMGDGGETHTDIVADLSEASLYDIVYTIVQAHDLDLDDLLLVWASPPCTTFSHLMNLNRSKGAKSHRVLDSESPDYLEPLPGIDGDLARRHDEIIINMLQFLNVLPSTSTSTSTSTPLRPPVRKATKRHRSQGGLPDAHAQSIQFLENFSRSKAAHVGLTKILCACAETSRCAGLGLDVAFGPLRLVSSGNKRRREESSESSD